MSTKQFKSTWPRVVRSPEFNEGGMLAIDGCRDSETVMRWIIVASWWAQEFLDRPRRKHLTTDPACRHHRAPRPGSWLDKASRGLECEPCMIARAFGRDIEMRRQS